MVGDKLFLQSRIVNHNSATVLEMVTGTWAVLIRSTKSDFTKQHSETVVMV